MGFINQRSHNVWGCTTVHRAHAPTPGQVFLAVPGLSDVQMEVQTGTQNRPAMLLRTAQGAVCPAEALIGSHCRGPTSDDDGARR